jgi:hypothetical protein
MKRSLDCLYQFCFSSSITSHSPLIPFSFVCDSNSALQHVVSYLSKHAHLLVSATSARVRMSSIASSSNASSSLLPQLSLNRLKPAGAGALASGSSSQYQPQYQPHQQGGGGGGGGSFTARAAAGGSNRNDPMTARGLAPRSTMFVQSSWRVDCSIRFSAFLEHVSWFICLPFFIFYALVLY